MGLGRCAVPPPCAVEGTRVLREDAVTRRTPVIALGDQEVGRVATTGRRNLLRALPLPTPPPRLPPPLPLYTPAVGPRSLEVDPVTISCVDLFTRPSLPPQSPPPQRAPDCGAASEGRASRQ